MATAERFIIESMFSIPNKEGETVDFVLNPAQSSLDAFLTGRDIIPKARQEGISSYVLARFTAKCLLYQNRRCVVISHNTEATQKMLERVHFFINNIKGPKPVLKGTGSKNAIHFAKTNSSFYIGTAGATKFGRGDTITDLHCSEVAFWDNPEELTAGLFQAVPHHSGEIFIESTGNGIGNFYHRRCLAAKNGDSRYRLHFFNWQDFPEYVSPVTDEEALYIMNNLRDDWDEPKLALIPGITAGHIKFRREKLDEMDWDFKKFRQEYPTSFNECFQASGESIFYATNHVKTDDWVADPQLPKATMLKGHPRSGTTYVMGADVAGGVDKDASTIQVIDTQRDEQVFEYRNTKIPPDDFAHVIAGVGERFGFIPVGVESNNHGILTLNELEKIYPNHLIFFAGNDNVVGYGLKTTRTTKPLWVGLMRKRIAKSLLTHSTNLESEMSTFVEDEHGRLGASKGCHDDLVIAMVMAIVTQEGSFLGGGSVIGPSEQKPEDDQFSLDHMIRELMKRAELHKQRNHGSGFSSKGH